MKKTKEYFKKTLQLTSKTFYKTIEFQLLFKFFYVGIVLFLGNLFVNTILNTTSTFTTKIHFDKTIQYIHIAFLFDFKVIFIFVSSILIFTFIYLTEKNGVIIITSEYYRNNFIGSFKALLISIHKTPIFILRRINEIRFTIYTFIGLYVCWKIMTLFTLPSWFMPTFATILIIYGIIILYLVLFHYTFTAYITCLTSSENPTNFNNQISHKSLRERFHVIIIFYIIFICAILLWSLFFYYATQALLHFSATYPTSISTILPFFISFTIMSILIVLSLFKTIKVSLMTVLYYQERNKQNKDIIIINKPIKQPLLSQNVHLAFLVILIITILISSTIIISSIKSKTIYIVNNANSYIEQTKKEDVLFNTIQSKNINISKFTEKKSTISIIEEMILTYLAYIVDK